jgi:hypothetical protein
VSDTKTDYQVANNTNYSRGHIKQRRLSRLEAQVLDQRRRICAAEAAGQSSLIC